MGEPHGSQSFRYGANRCAAVGDGVGVGARRIGLAAAPRLTTRRGRTDSVDWQRNSRDYQFWGTVGPDGRFALPQVRPGTYTLYAIADGVPGEFSQTGFVVHAGQNLDCGTLTWEPERGRQTLWQIGVADRSAEVEYPTFEDGLRQLRIVEAVIESSGKRAWLDVG